MALLQRLEVELLAGVVLNGMAGLHIQLVQRLVKLLQRYHIVSVILNKRPACLVCVLDDVEVYLTNSLYMCHPALVEHTRGKPYGIALALCHLHAVQAVHQVGYAATMRAESVYILIEPIYNTIIHYGHVFGFGCNRDYRVFQQLPFYVGHIY